MKQRQRPVPIKGMNFNTPPVINTEIMLEIEGYLPDAAWELLEEKVSIDEIEKSIFIRIDGKRDPMLMAAQVVRTFKKNIPLVFKTGGKWKIQCNDKNLEIVV